MKKTFFSSLRPSVRRFAHAMQLLEQGEAVEAFSIFADLARRDDPQAQYQVGQCYLSGNGVLASLEEGARWVSRAAHHGMPEACFTLATLYAMGLPEGFDPTTTFNTVDALTAEHEHAEKHPDFEQAELWARRGAEAGNADAQALLAHILTHGPKELRDERQARYWYEKAADGGALQGYLGLGLLLVGEAKTEDEKRRAAAYLTKASEGDLGTACATLGWMYETGFAVKQSFDRAAHYYEKAAENNIPPAQARYGLMLLKGVGVEANITRAESWLRRAAYNGDADAAALLGDLYIRGEDFVPVPSEALKWYRLAAENGHVAATRALALLYLTGTGTERDPKKAAHWFQVAAEKGDKHAVADFGNMILAGVPQSDEAKEEMQERFRHLAESGDPLGAFNLGVCLAQGLGGGRDETRALYWMSKARDGIVNAQYWYGRMLYEGIGLSADPVNGLKWIEKAAEAGMPEACVAAAQLLVTGAVAGRRDHQKALALYHQAAEQGNVDAFFSLGAMYGGGHDIPTDRSRAFDYFEKAAQRGHGLAQMMVGRYLARGLAGHTDVDQARLWLRRAVKNGAKEAEKDLKELDQQRLSAEKGEDHG
ncbi:tetratricopeptide repeat protein [Saccharibacter floricola]|nr:tetratricopeptide repeat protein [Saccharibacter floricola]